MTLIKAENLGVSFDGRTVVSGLNFDIENGDFFCILGENGSGKTTLMRCILGLGVHYSGKLIFNGFDRREIGWLPQRTEIGRDFPAGVREVIMSGFAGKRFFSPRYNSEQRKTAEKNMRLLEIEGLKNRAFSELSGGQQQRVLLCRALCAADKILLLDEPVTGLDNAAEKELYSAVELLHRSGITIIMITHNSDYALSHAEHILHIGNKESFCGTPEQYVLTPMYRNGKENLK